MRLNRDHLKLILSAIGITAIAVIERIYMAIKSPTINVDGPLYIYQAMELYYGLANKMVTCGLNHISPYPFLIAFVYSLQPGLCQLYFPCFWGYRFFFF